MRQPVMNGLRFDLPPTAEPEGRARVEAEFPGLLSRRPRAMSVWTPEEEAHVLSLASRKLPLSTVADLLSRSVWEILGWFRMWPLERLADVEPRRLERLRADLAAGKETTLTCEVHAVELRLDLVPVRGHVFVCSHAGGGGWPPLRSELHRNPYPNGRLWATRGGSDQMLVAFCQVCRTHDKRLESAQSRRRMARFKKALPWGAAIRKTSALAGSDPTASSQKASPSR